MQDYSTPVPPPQPTYQSPLPRLLVILTVLLALLLLPSIVERVQFGITRGRERAIAEAAKESLTDHKLDSLSSAFTLIPKAVGPSVVHIDTSRIVGGSSDDEFQFFGDQPQYEARGQGSGVIVDKAGYIVTNNHVIKDAETIQVSLSDGRTMEAEVVGADPPTDLAVLKIDADSLTVCNWGDSDKLEAGTMVFAIGNPFGLDRSVTFGIISAKNRRASQFQDFLQIDAAINPGNSGGPLVNVDGEVVGINTAIIGQAYQGVGFSLPSNTAHDVYNRLRQTGKVARAWLGVALEVLTPEVARQLEVDPPRGALIKEIVPGAPGDKAGLQVGDVVVEWNGTAVETPTELSLVVAKTQIGSEAKATIIRDGQKMTIDVKVEERPAQPQLRRRQR